VSTGPVVQTCQQIGGDALHSWKLGGWSQQGSSVLIREDSDMSTHTTGTECAVAL